MDAFVKGPIDANIVVFDVILVKFIVLDEKTAAQGAVAEPKV